MVMGKNHKEFVVLINFKIMKIIITGGLGFIGSHLVDMLLKKGAKKVVIFDNFIRGGFHNLTEALRDNRVELFEVKGDITHMDELDEAMKGMDGVFHLAALCLAHCQDYPRASLEVNIVGTFNLLDACVKNNVKSEHYFIKNDSQDNGENKLERKRSHKRRRRMRKPVKGLR